LKKTYCENCLKEAELLFVGLCHECFEQLKAEVGGITLPEEDDPVVVELPKSERSMRKQKSVELFEKPINDWLKQVLIVAIADSRKGLEQVRFGICLNDPDVSDIELLIHQTEKGVALDVPKDMNYGQVKLGRVKNRKNGGAQLCFNHTKPDVAADDVPIPATHEKRLALAEKLRMDMMIEAQRDLAEVA